MAATRHASRCGPARMGSSCSTPAREFVDWEQFRPPRRKRSPPPAADAPPPRSRGRHSVLSPALVRRLRIGRLGAALACRDSRRSNRSLPIAATFPLEVKDIPGTITFRDVPEEEWKSGSVRLRAQPIIHPGPTVGYRLEEDGRSLAYLPDHEPARGADFESRAPEWISGLSLADEVDVLIRRAVHRRGIPREDRLGALKPYACHRLCTPRESRASRALPP